MTVENRNSEDRAEFIEELARRASHDLTETRGDVDRQVSHVARALALPPALGVILLGLVVFGATDGSVRGSGAVSAALVVVAGALILVPPLLYARSPDAYVELQDHTADALAGFAKALSSGRDKSD
jgi:hypothetical protein